MSGREDSMRCMQGRWLRELDSLDDEISAFWVLHLLGLVIRITVLYNI